VDSFLAIYARILANGILIGHINPKITFILGGITMSLSAQERAAIITVAGSWAIKSLEGAGDQELRHLVKTSGSLKYEDMLITSFLSHYENLTSCLFDAK
jgi:hypothetical protein